MCYVQCTLYYGMSHQTMIYACFNQAGMCPSPVVKTHLGVLLRVHFTVQWSELFYLLELAMLLNINHMALNCNWDNQAWLRQPCMLLQYGIWNHIHKNVILVLALFLACPLFVHASCMFTCNIIHDYPRTLLVSISHGEYIVCNLMLLGIVQLPARNDIKAASCKTSIVLRAHYNPHCNLSSCQFSSKNWSRWSILQSFSSLP